jgi:preprotein translocase SecE subunit
VPGELEHASGEVDEFEAALVSGADGQVVDDDELDTRDEVDAAQADATEADAADDLDDELPAPAAREEADLDDDAYEDDDVDDATLEREAAAAAPRRAAADSGPAHPPTRKGPGRFVGFLQASWAELQRVQWPDRRQVAQATGVVLGFVIIAGLYLGVADWVAKEIVNAII